MIREKESSSLTTGPGPDERMQHQVFRNNTDAVNAQPPMSSQPSHRASGVSMSIANSNSNPQRQPPTARESAWPMVGKRHRAGSPGYVRDLVFISCAASGF